MSVTQVVIRKELRETLRDWRTMLMMVVIPILLYPAMLVIGQQLALFGMRRIEAAPARVAVSGAVPQELVSFLSRQGRLQAFIGASGDGASIRAGEADAIVRVAPASPAESTLRVEILFDETRERSAHAHRLVRAALGEWSDSLLVRRLEARGLPADFATPLLLTESSIAGPAERGGYFLGRFLPLLLIMITLMGAFYPAIDLAAGEKERGTLETLLTAPVAASSIVAGKFVTVALLGVVAAILNLGSMLLTFQVGLFDLPEQFAVSLGLRSLLVVLLTLVPLAVLFGALFLGIAVRSHSFKEAQNSLTPVYMAVLLPAVLPLVPGIELSAAMAIVPIAGVALLFRELLSGTAEAVPAVLVLASTAVYAAMALRFAARSFGREDVLFGAPEPDHRAGWGRDGWRGVLGRLHAGAPRPTLAQALLFVAAVAGLFFYVGVTLQVRMGERGFLLAQWLLLLVPALLFVRLGRFDARRTLSLAAPAPRHVGGALLLIAGGLPLAWTLAWAQSFFIELPEELVRALTELARAHEGRSIVWVLLLVAVTPAVCEEFVFRGVLLGGSRAQLGTGKAVLLNAAVFGAFHLSFESAIRFLPTAWLGLLLAYAVWRTGSIWTSVLMHFLSNGTVVVLVSLPATAAWLAAADRPPAPLIAAGVVMLCGGLVALGVPPARDAAGQQRG
jgi:sodium transport system permease protein